MKRVKFEVGKVYSVSALYGGCLVIRVVDRTDSTVSFVYTDDEAEEVETQPILVQKYEVWNNGLEVLGTVESETTLAWTYHSPYAENPDDIDYAYFSAFDDGQLYTPEEFEQL